MCQAPKLIEKKGNYGEIEIWPVTLRPLTFISFAWLGHYGHPGRPDSITTDPSRFLTGEETPTFLMSCFHVNFFESMVKWLFFFVLVLAFEELILSQQWKFCWYEGKKLVIKFALYYISGLSTVLHFQKVSAVVFNLISVQCCVCVHFTNGGDVANIILEMCKSKSLAEIERHFFSRPDVELQVMH